MNNTQEQRPLILEVEDVKQSLIQTINEAVRRGVPCFILEPIMNDLTTQVKMGAKEELLRVQKQEVKKETTK